MECFIQTLLKNQRSNKKNLNREVFNEKYFEETDKPKTSQKARKQEPI